MKKYLVLVLSVALFACTQQSGFRIDVQLEGAEGQVLLEERVAGAWNSIDTAEVVDGVAVLEGEVANPGVYYLSIAGQRAKTMIFVENAKMSVTGKMDSLSLVKVTGSATHDEYDMVNSEVQDITEAYMALYQESRAANAAGDTTKGRELMDKVNKMYDGVGVLQTYFVKKNPASYVTPYYLSQIQYGKEVEELDSMVNALDPKLQNVQTIVDLKERIAKLKTVAVGQMAPDFVQNDKDGNPIKFSDIYSKNELTLLDFWASWCGPCRSENPNVVAVFNEYKGKGFSVFGVSLDSDKDKWLKAIEDDKLAWDHVSDLGGWGNAASSLYAVNSIPSSLLVDKTGKIVAKNKREAELREAVVAFLDARP
ncbi:MAG: AhpC/TSA family protein [Bacteroidetes bacterium]|nr:AhpC/TSA family protein [Bacteroidota bacterium]